MRKYFAMKFIHRLRNGEYFYQQHEGYFRTLIIACKKFFFTKSGFDIYANKNKDIIPSHDKSY